MHSSAPSFWWKAIICFRDRRLESLSWISRKSSTCSVEWRTDLDLFISNPDSNRRETIVHELKSLSITSWRISQIQTKKWKKSNRSFACRQRTISDKRLSTKTTKRWFLSFAQIIHWSYIPSRFEWIDESLVDGIIRRRRSFCATVKSDPRDVSAKVADDDEEGKQLGSSSLVAPFSSSVGGKIRWCPRTLRFRFSFKCV